MENLRMKMLSKQEMKAVKGGYSRFYCTIKHPRVVVFGITISQGNNYDECRKARDRQLATVEPTIEENLEYDGDPVNF
ncbi:hypothetical protein [Pedobacter endophyticus]|uniref:Uncharacterized protein n=1 Tax=Pedobacter endophyticus TaxID=2789740 RepID=A0A7S9KYI8_9SPHI|nr:hypothetical protein [Pedobacter endophyticus]QPH39219.1 hypothetical protein IZT61_19545 [Pedobacter endophyticus]